MSYFFLMYNEKDSIFRDNHNNRILFIFVDVGFVVIVIFVNNISYVNVYVCVWFAVVSQTLQFVCIQLFKWYHFKLVLNYVKWYVNYGMWLPFTQNNFQTISITDHVFLFSSIKIIVIHKLFCLFQLYWSNDNQICSSNWREKHPLK